MSEIKNIILAYSRDHEESVPDENLSEDICNGLITMDEIKTHLSKLKNNKAAGIDGISGEFLKYVSDDICETLFALYNSMFERGDWPTKWAEGIINPVHKKASINVPDNYRKITVMPALGKVFESILNARLKFRNVVLNIDDPYQFGFKEGSRTTDNIFILQSLVYRQKFKGKPLYLCFVDFTKAFDYVNRYALYYKLTRRGIHGKLLNIIWDMYDKAVCRVKWKDVIGEEIGSEYGVLQGGMLSPKLFTEFLYDLKEDLNSKFGMSIDDTLMTYILYADDLVLCSESADGLQKLIDGLYQFCSKWHLIVSLAKTNILIFGKNKPSNSFKFDNKVIEVTTEYKYLGTVIATNTHSMFKKNNEHLADKARNALFALNSYVQNSVGYLHPSLAFKMFDVQISPIIEYASEIWYNGQVTPELEKIHLGYLKNTLKVKPSSTTCAIYAECGRFPLIVKQKYQTIKFWKRIIGLDNAHIVKKAYNSLLELHNLGQQNWCTHVNSILSEVDYQQPWDEQILNNKQLANIKEKLHKDYMSQCLETINDSSRFPKLRTYKLFKREFRLEPYLISPKNIHYSLALLKFRISSHNLHIETGRYSRPNKTPVNERFCHYCSSQAVEDEPHFLLDCSLYDIERKHLFDTVEQRVVSTFSSFPYEDKFIFLMSSVEPIVVDAMSKYIYISFQKRNMTAGDACNVSNVPSYQV